MKIVTAIVLLVCATARADVPFDPQRQALACVKRDPTEAEQRAQWSNIIHVTPLKHSCVRCLARGLDGKPVELDPLVCDSLEAQLRAPLGS